MTRPFSFSTFSNCLIGKERSSQPTGQEGVNYAFVVIQNQLSINEIDLSRFSYEDLVDVYVALDEVITGDDTDGRILIDPNSTYTRILSLQEKIVRMGKLPKYRPPSPFLFL